MSNPASLVLCVFRRVKDHQHLLHDSPRSKKTCVRQVALDKWLPLIAVADSVHPVASVARAFDAVRSSFIPRPFEPRSFQAYFLKTLRKYRLDGARRGKTPSTFKTPVS